MDINREIEKREKLITVCMFSLKLAVLLLVYLLGYAVAAI